MLPEGVWKPRQRTCSALAGPDRAVPTISRARSAVSVARRIVPPWVEGATMPTVPRAHKNRLGDFGLVIFADHVRRICAGDDRRRRGGPACPPRRQRPARRPAARPPPHARDLAQGGA